MGYRWRTNVQCTNPELIASGSTFNKKCKEFILSIESGISKYYCIGQDFNYAPFQFSREHPLETFTGVTWNDSDYYDCIEFTLIINNGEYKQVKSEPHYTYALLYRNWKKVPEELYRRFREHFKRYAERIDVVHRDFINGEVFDFLNDRKDKFTGTKRCESFVEVKYQKKNHKHNKITNTETEILTCNQDESEYELPF
jgi:hypothetical protein